MGGIRAAAILLALLMLVACGGEDRAIREWTLRTGDGPPAAVVLPAHLEHLLPPGVPVHYTLHARVGLTAEERGRDLVLLVPRPFAHVTVQVNGTAAPPLEPQDPRGYRTRGEQLWSIPATATSGDAIELDLDVAHTWTQSGWIDIAPRLTREPWGSARLAAVPLFNLISAYIALGFVSFTAYLYLGVYLTDRRRTAYGWFAMTGLVAALYPMFETGLLQRFLGPWEVTMAGFAVSLAVVTNMHFTRAWFGLAPPARAWLAASSVACLVCALSTGYFTGTRVAGTATVIIVVPGILTQLLLLVRLLRQDTPPVDAAIVLGGWPFLALAATPELLAWLGNGECAGGLHGGSLGIAVIAMLQTAALSRAHTRTLRATEDLARERGERLTQFERLNDELRRQVAARSHQLANALASLGSDKGALVLPAGSVVEGRYRIGRTLGAGAGGTVYLVERLLDGASFAMKVVAAGDDMQALARLAREAQLAAAVKDPRVVAIVDVDVAAGGFLYIVMEYVPGTNLRDARDRYGDIPWALSILRQIAEGLAVVHAQGIVHRDLKPANVLLVERGDRESSTIKIADFGIARGPGRPRSTPPSGPGLRAAAITVREADPRLTITGMLLGTPLYMAPEVVDGSRDSTAAVDIFAFGVIAYEVLSGKAPFRQSPALAQLDGVHVEPPVSLSAACPDAPGAIVALVDRCLAFDPDGRPSAGDLASAFRAYRRSPHQATSEESTESHVRSPVR